MSIWSSIAKMGTGALKGTWGFTKASGKSLGNSVIHPVQTLRGAGSALKTAAVGGAAGYVAWEKLTTDKGIVEIVGDAVVGEKTANSISETMNDVKDLKNKAGETIDAVNNAMSDVNSKWSGMNNFFRGIFGGNGGNMFGNFFGNLAKGNVSGLGIAGLIAAAFLTFGRVGWLGKIAGAILGMMLIGSNSNMQSLVGGNGVSRGPAAEKIEEERLSGGMKR